MRFARVVFLVAGIYGLIVIAPLYFMEARIGSQMPPEITHPEYFYGFVGVTLAWQFAFLVLSTDPLRYRPLMLPAMVEKVTYGIAVIVLYSQHRILPIVFAFGCVDWILLSAFVAAYALTRRPAATAREYST